MGNLTTAVIIVVMLNVFMFLTQASLVGIKETDATNVYNCDGTMLGIYSDDCQNGDMALINNTNIPSLFPGSSQATSPTTGNIFTDVFSSIKNWMLDTLGLRYVFAILSAPYSMLSLMNLPHEFVFALGSLWYIISAFLIIAFLWWRD